MKLEVFLFYVKNPPRLRHFPRMYQMILRLMICIRGIHGRVSIDCRLTSNPQTAHVSKLYTARACSMKTKTAAHRLYVHLHATTLLVTTSQLTSRQLSRARLHITFDFRSESQYRSIYAVTIRPKSLYEDVHASTGHPGYTGMQWHQKNTIGANYTDKDAA